MVQTIITQAVRSVRRVEPPQTFPKRADLNVVWLSKILKDGPVPEQSEARGSRNDRKRAAPEMSNHSKRAKTSKSEISTRVSRQTPEEIELLQVYSHVFELGYTRGSENGVMHYGHFVDDKEAAELGWSQEETELTELLSEKSQGETMPCSFDLGEIVIGKPVLGDDGGTIYLCHGSQPNPVDSHSYYPDLLLTLPVVPFSDGRSWSNTDNLFSTCWHLLQSGHVSMDASASITFLPNAIAPALPIQINVSISVSLIIPNIFQPHVLHVPPSFSIADRRRRLLSHLFCPVPGHPDQFTYNMAEEAVVRRFYSILVPPPPVSLMMDEALQPQGLRATLLPFQRRSVKWLLEREFKTIGVDGQIIPMPEDPETLPLFWQRVNARSVSGEGVSSVPPTDTTNYWYYNRLTGCLMDHKPSAKVAGAMLCEEMGLGKTVECLALILLNPTTDRDPSVIKFDEQTQLEVSAIKTNLIVTPTTLSQQWLDEIARHAPSLRVLFYNGYKKVKLSKTNKIEGQAFGSSKTHHIWCSFFHNFDIVVTTYKTLQDELAVAKAPIVRPKRKAASYSHVEKSRSPLVRVEWARVFMDEVQMVGGGKTAEMVSLIPRVVSVAVSGTPAMSKVSDLSHVLKFLRIEDDIWISRTWQRLLRPDSWDLFADIFKKYAIRTLKSSVRQELTIPLQRRYAVGIELGRVERLVYDETLQEALDNLGVDARGVAELPEWELDIGALRSWLRRLRQICTHPQIGALRGYRATAKTVGATTIKTMHDVLKDLQAKTWQNLIIDLRSKIQLTLRRAQLVQKVDEDPTRYHKARDLLLSAQAETKELVEDIKATLTEHEALGKRIREETATRRRERKRRAEESPSPNGKGKGRESDLESMSSEDSEDDMPHTRIGEEYRARQRSLLSRLRESFVLHHKVSFLLGDVYHALGEQHVQDENASYEAAEAIRRSLLKNTEDAATSSMNQLSHTFQDKSSLRRKDFKIGPCQKGGIRSTHIMEEANDILDLLNGQADQLWEWRTHIHDLLTQKLSAPENQEADGEEYVRALDTQGEVEAYLQAYATLLADRKEGLIAERTVLATHDAREVRARITAAARKAGEPAIFDDDIDDNESRDNLQDAALQQQLANIRKSLRGQHGTRALKTVMILLSEIGQRVGDRTEEAQIAREESKRLRNIITEQGAHTTSATMEKLELELASFRKVFNDRIQYFRQLQELSDTVVEVEWEGDVLNVINASKAEEDQLIMSINRKRAQARHLRSLAKDQEEGDLEEARDCVLCRCTFQVGLMTPCAHIFCEPCLKEWMKTRRADCPVCRAKISANALQRISLGHDNTDTKPEGNIEHPLNSSRSIRFNSLPVEMLNEIQTFEAHGSYGSKIMHLIRHLLFLQHQEPGTKSVVFSAWRDSLLIIEQALITNGIHCIRVDQTGKRTAAQQFKEDPSILVFLLHGERENAGLNLTCAKRVWLIEPTVNHSFEVQAISRVDRMGQTASTEVFCYYIEDSVEENILRMGAKRGFSLYVQDHSEDVIDISEFAMGMRKTHIDSRSNKGKQKGDFIEKADDMIHVLFPHLDYQDTDFVTDDCVVTDIMAVDDDHTVDGALGFVSSNAVAGPSRLGNQR